MNRGSGLLDLLVVRVCDSGTWGSSEGWAAEFVMASDEAANQLCGCADWRLQDD